MNKPDSLIFDLDGTLWDAVPTYAKAWNIVFQNRKLDIYLHPDDLYPLMGMAKEQYLSLVLPDLDEDQRDAIYEEVVQVQYGIIPKDGGILYPNVKDGLSLLSKRFKLLILSNCPPYIIHHFLDWSGFEEYFTDHLSYGLSPLPKAENIKLLMSKHQLSSPVYIGDTHSDGVQASTAGIPFVFASYGFGETDTFDLKFKSFRELTEYFKAV